MEEKQLRPLLLLHENAREDFAGVPESIAEDGADATSVLVGLAPDKFNYDTLTKAFQ